MFIQFGQAVLTQIQVRVSRVQKTTFLSAQSIKK
jgi:hypothetical protein